ncbi:MAG: DUF4398 domain-containing protein [Pseudomonadota bacterium]
MIKKTLKKWLAILCGASMVLMVGCSTQKTPAIADVAASQATVDSAATAGAMEYAPVEMKSAREKLALAKQAMVLKDYKSAIDLSNQAQADAQLAQGKANSAKAQEAAKALQEDIRVLREELNRTQ